MKLTLWRLLIMYSVTYLQVIADDQLILSDVTNTSNEWFGWSEENSLDGAYWIVCNDAILLNTTSENGTVEQQYSLLSPSYMTLNNNCNISISYTRQAEISVEVIARSSDGNNVTIANLSGTIGERQTVELPVNISQSIAQLIFSVTSNLNDELLSIDNVTDCSDVVSPTPLVESSLMIIVESTTTDLLQTSSVNFDISTGMIFTSLDGLTASRILSSSDAAASSSVMIISSTASILATSELLSIPQSTSLPINMSTVDMTSISSPSAILSSIMSSSITSSLLISDITVSSMTSATVSAVTMVTVQSSSNVQSANTMTETASPSIIVSTTNISLLSTTVMPSSSNATEGSGDTNFFSTNVIIGISAGGGTLLLILLCLLICCLCRMCVCQRNQKHKYFISDNTGYKPKGHSSVYAQERYRHKSRSVESVSGPYHYEIPFVHVEQAPEAYVHSTNGDEDTIDSESEDIRRDLKGTPTSSRPESQSAADHETIMTSFYPQTDHHWSDYSSDNDEDETSSDIVYPNKSLINDMCTGELPPILSLGDYEDDEDVVIVNPYNHPTFYSESVHIPNKDASPKRTATNINLEALTTLETSGEYTPKQSVPNYRRKQSRYAAGKNHKLLRKTKSELNLEDATKIAGVTRYPKHQSKSRIDLKEATKLAAGHSDVTRVNHHHRKPHYSSTPRILDSSSKLERLTSLDT